MAITPTLLDVGHFTTGGVASVTTANNVLPVTGKVHLATFVSTSTIQDRTPSCSGCGLTWAVKANTSGSISGGAGQITVFEGTGTPSSGKLTFAGLGNDQDASFWSVSDYSEQPTIRNTATATKTGFTPMTVTLPAVQSGNSLTVGFIYMQNVAISDGGGFTNLYNDDFPGAGQQDGEYKLNSNTASWTWSLSDSGFAAALELAQASAPNMGMIGSSI